MYASSGVAPYRHARSRSAVTRLEPGVTSSSRLGPAARLAAELERVLDRIADDRTGHAVTAAPAAAQLSADDGDHLHAGLAEQRIGVRVAVVGEHHTRLDGHQVVAAVPLLPLGVVGGAAGLDHP